MERKTKRIARNQGKVEFLANLDEIQAMLSKGYNKRNVHNILFEKGLITMSYYTFCDNYISYNKTKKSDKSTGSFATPPAAKSPPTSGPRIVNTAKEPFPDPRKMSLEDGI